MDFKEKYAKNLQTLQSARPKGLEDKVFPQKAMEKMKGLAKKKTMDFAVKKNINQMKSKADAFNNDKKQVAKTAEQLKSTNETYRKPMMPKDDAVYTKPMQPDVKKDPAPKKPSGNMNTNSIVDYMKSVGQNSAYSNRKKMARAYGIAKYRGTAQQNAQMLKMLRDKK